MPIYHDPGLADAAIRALLDHSSVTDLLDGGIHQDLAHDGADCPYVLYQAISDVPAHALGGGSRIQTISILVRSVGTTEAEAATIASAVERRLHGAAPTIAGYTVLSLLNEGGGSRYADDSGLYNAAAYYRLRLYRNS